MIERISSVIPGEVAIAESTVQCVPCLVTFSSVYSHGVLQNNIAQPWGLSPGVQPSGQEAGQKRSSLPVPGAPC